MKKLIYVNALMLCISSLFIFSSCTKHDDENGRPIAQGSPQDKRIKSLIRSLPIEKLVKENQRVVKMKEMNGQRDGGWSFADPNTGTAINFSDGNLTITTNPTSPPVLNISTSALGNNTGSGVVVAGPTALDINYTFCFSSTDQSYGLNLFDLNNGGFNGVSSVIGVSGDFSKLETATDSTPFSDIFHGLAFYIVYDGQATGTYNVIDWLDGISDSTATQGNSFAFLFDFVNGRLFLSADGTIDVTGGMMNFQGHYLEVSGFMDEDGDVDLDGDLQYSIVSGFGQMGCN